MFNRENIEHIKSLSSYGILIVVLAFMLYCNQKLKKNNKKMRLTLLEEESRREELQKEVDNLSTILVSSDDAIICSNLDGTILRWNKSAEEIYGYTEEEAIGKNISIISGRENIKEVQWLSSNLEVGETIKNYETKRYTKDGREISICVTLSPIKDNEGNILYVAGIDREITEKVKDREKLIKSYDELSMVYNQLAATEDELRNQIIELKNHEKALKLSEERYKLVLEGANDAIWELDFSDDSFFISSKWEVISENTILDIDDLNEAISRYVHPEDIETVIKELQDHITGNSDNKEYYQSEFRIKTKYGKYKWVNSRGKIIRDSDGNAIKMAGSITDINEKKESQEKIRYLAYYDPLTNLPNRLWLKEKLNEIIEESGKNNEKFALLFIDIDNFKMINDILGHDFGDDVMKGISSTINQKLPPAAIMGRNGGDEFMVILKNTSHLKEVCALCHNILEPFKTSINIKDTNIYTGISMGICIYPFDGSTPKELLRNSDAALYHAKKNGKNQYCVFNKTMAEEIIRKGTIEKGLREALINNEFIMYYQPQLDIKTGKIGGYEALIRWNSKELGWVSPGEFIPVAEESGIIRDIGFWVIKDVCRQIRIWKEKNLKLSSIAINISPIQLHESRFIENMLYILQSEGLSPEDLEIEITENVLINFYDKNILVLNRLKDLNFSVALDDFGTGYSSLNYLRVMPINKLKIDKSFIDFIEKDKNITEGIIELSHNMGIEVVAEGVETQGQVSILESMSCDKIQGYYFSKPLSAEEVEIFADPKNVSVSRNKP
ncbi:EAL domain-containing protein [Clostridium sp. MSJ-4]|uniref:EAL domain-containing protein n=1 Tax=Clostridium simiarum TaxID=2841506 RepID=A0ABS6F4K7_9CLOT|nr:EAL domain-containing protein [Clostridium simiarum]MBU5592477.1 EAL domain-containing protein [Clostridium simiarum]